MCWAHREHPCENATPWFELSGAATASLTVHALLALASERHATPLDIARTASVYPRLSLLATMLDSYVDQGQDIDAGLHSYIGHYGDFTQIALRLTAIASESTAAVSTLRRGDNHAAILASMIALYLTSDQARVGTRRQATDAVLQVAPQVTRLLMPALRIWRTTHRLTDA